MIVKKPTLLFIALVVVQAGEAMLPERHVRFCATPRVRLLMSLQQKAEYHETVRRVKQDIAKVGEYIKILRDRMKVRGPQFLDYERQLKSAWQEKANLTHILNSAMTDLERTSA